ncbi:hypothetical protein RFI_06053, partial [Reticulomyxa filosa]
RNRLDVKDYLKSNGEKNTMEITFQSKVWWALDEANSCQPDSSDEQCPTQCPPDDYHGFCDVNFIRTEPCSFSWVICPDIYEQTNKQTNKQTYCQTHQKKGFAPVGVFRDIYLQGYDYAVTRDVLFSMTPIGSNTKVKTDKTTSARMSDRELIAETLGQDVANVKEYTQWHLLVNVFIDAGVTDVLSPSMEYERRIMKRQKALEDTKITGSIIVSMTEVNRTARLSVSLMAGTEANFTVDMGVIDNVRPWYPNGFGTQTLYPVTVHFDPWNNASQTDSGIRVDVGFRQVQLVQDTLPGGKSFFFRINDVNVPIHGSNWIPVDSFESRVTSQNLEQLFLALKNSHQNMIRVWGGGIYQRDSIFMYIYIYIYYYYYYYYWIQHITYTRININIWFFGKIVRYHDMGRYCLFLFLFVCLFF